MRTPLVHVFLCNLCYLLLLFYSIIELCFTLVKHHWDALQSLTKFRARRNADSLVAAAFWIFFSSPNFLALIISKTLLPTAQAQEAVWVQRDLCFSIVWDSGCFRAFKEMHSRLSEFNWSLSSNAGVSHMKRAKLLFIDERQGWLSVSLSRKRLSLSNPCVLYTVCISCWVLH